MPAPLFLPFRALGLITEDLPFCVSRRGKETFVCVSVGKSWQIYNNAKLTLTLVGPQLSDAITALACKGDLTFAAAGSTVVECKRVHRNGTYGGAIGTVFQLLVLGDYLAGLTRDGQLLMWRIGSYGEPEIRIRFAPDFHPSCLVHPDTYLNKLLVGGTCGRMQLWNFATQTLLYTFKGWGSPVRCLASSPALDVVGVGLQDGRAVLHNLKFDELVVQFSNAAGVGLRQAGGPAGTSTSSDSGDSGPCTCIAFRTGSGVPLMAAGGVAGSITLWHLEERRLHSVLASAHDKHLVSLHFMAGEPLLMSAAADNSIKHWVFDGADDAARLLRFRSGHSAPPTVVMHYSQGERLLSAGRDRAFRMFSAVQDQQSRELSQKHAARRAKRLKLMEADVKLPRVVDLDANDVRERDWCNVLTAHEGSPAAYTWRLAHFVLGEHKLQPPTTGGSATPAAAVTAVCLSPCGNFGVTGSAAGRLDRFNMQSGLHRGEYCRRQEQKVLPAHSSAVRGVAVHSGNRWLVSAGGDAMVRVWDFRKCTLLREVCVGAPVTHLALHGCLAALACDDLVLRVVDVEAGALVRRFSGHRDRITCLRVSSDGRWLLSSSMDSTLRVWDVPAAMCLQVLQMSSPVVSLSLSPQQDLLATCHAGSSALCLWANQLMFGDASAITHSDALVNVEQPTPASGRGGREDGEGGEEDTAKEEGSDEDSEQSEESEEGEESEEEEDVAAAGGSGIDVVDEARKASGGAASSRSGAAPLAPSLVTLSLLPRAQWQSLLSLEDIKARNKPLEPPKKAAAAPFFLPSAMSGPGSSALAGLEGDGAMAVDEPSRPVKRVQSSLGGAAKAAGLEGEGLVPLLRSCSESGDYAPVMAVLRELSPSALDREIRAMEVLEGCTPEEVEDVGRLLECLLQQTRAGTDFEFCQAVTSLVLQVHGESMMKHEQLRQLGVLINRESKDHWRRMDDLLQSVRCMVSYFGHLHS